MRDFTPLLPKKESRKETKPHPARRQGPRKAAGSEKPEGTGEDDGEEEFLLDEYESDGEEGTRRQAGKRAHCGGGSSSESEGDGDEEEEEEEVTPKVFFTSRTHSQLSQFVGELKKTTFSEKLRTVCLGSRKNLCINTGEWIWFVYFGALIGVS